MRFCKAVNAQSPGEISRNSETVLSWDIEEFGSVGAVNAPSLGELSCNSETAFICDIEEEFGATGAANALLPNNKAESPTKLDVESVLSILMFSSRWLNDKNLIMIIILA